MLVIQTSDTDANLALFSSARNRWKRMRNIMNPTFSNVKLKEVFKI